MLFRRLALLGEKARLLHAEGCQDPGRDKRVSGRALPGGQITVKTRQRMGNANGCVRVLTGTSQRKE